jgi:hypothetical protein
MYVNPTSTLGIQNYQRSQPVALQGRSGSSNVSSDVAGASSEASSVRPQDPAVEEKLADFSRVQSAFVAAIRTGEDIESRSLFSLIE